VKYTCPNYIKSINCKLCLSNTKIKS
jgi:hypothetical protein